MKRFTLLTSVVALMVMLCVGWSQSSHAKKPDDAGGGGGGTEIINPAFVIMDGDNISRLKLLSSDGLVEQEIVKAKAFRGMTAPTWSPDGQRIAYLKGEDSGRSLRTIRPDGSDGRIIYHFGSGTAPTPESSHGMQWVPGDVDRIIYLSYTGDIYTLSTLDEDPQPHLVLPQLFWLSGVTLSPDIDLDSPGYQGAIAFVDYTDRLLNVAFAADGDFGLEVDMASIVKAASLDDGVATPAWSHDGMEIAFLYHNWSIPDFGNSLEVIPVSLDPAGITLDENNVRIIYDSLPVDTYGPYHAVYHRPSWSPNDLLIGFAAQVGGEPSGSKAFDLFRAYSDGSGVVNVTKGSGRPVYMDWNPTWTFDLE